VAEFLKTANPLDEFCLIEFRVGSRQPTARAARLPALS
jgi:hypothetical protein